MLMNYVFVILGILCSGANGKGAYYGYRGYGGYYYYGGFGNGYYGSSFGGTLRTYRSGAYVPYSRYYLYPMIWTNGHHTRTYSDPTFEDTLLDVMCKRNVTVPTVEASKATFDSRRYCYHEASPLPFSAKNTKASGIMVDSYQWAVTTKPEPVVALTVYKDENQLSAPSFNASIRFLYLKVVDSVTKVPLMIYPLNDLFNGSQVTLPSGKTEDTTKLIYVDLNSDAGKSPLVSLRAQISDDFFEDINNHFFLRPSALQISVQVDGLPQYAAGSTYLELDTEISSVKAKSASLLHATVGSIYDPKQMDRLDLGALVDEQRGFVSWRRSINESLPCITAGAPQCVAEIGCGAAPGNCQLLNVSNNTFGWTLRVQSTPASPEFQFYLGYYDVAEMTPDEVGNSAWGLKPQLWIPLLGLLSILLL